MIKKRRRPTEEEKKEATNLLSLLENFDPRADGEIQKYLLKHSYRRVEKMVKGKLRKLDIPDTGFKYLLKKILSKILYKIPISAIAHCGILKRSVRTNVVPHLKGSARFKIDFKDAFPSVSSEIVSYQLEPLLERHLHLRNSQAKLLADWISQLATANNILPQGAPTSTYMMNLVCFQLDQQLIEAAKEFGLVCTRYNDDIIVSSRNQTIPKKAREKIMKIVKKYGFVINRKKVYYKTGHASVPKITGITLVHDEINEKIKTSLPRKKIEEYRLAIYNATQDPSGKDALVFGIIGWVVLATGGKIPNRLEKPIKKFLEKKHPEKIKNFFPDTEEIQ